MRSIILAIIAACKNVFGVGLALLSWPARVLFGDRGGGCEAPEIPMPQPLPEPPEDRTKIYEDIARAVMNWAADSVIADRPVDLPPRLPIGIREWLPGLSREECYDIVEADRSAVCAHIQGIFALQGVRAVQRLQSVKVWPAQLRAPESTGFAAIADLEMLERARA